MEEVRTLLPPARKAHLVIIARPISRTINSNRLYGWILVPIFPPDRMPAVHHIPKRKPETPLECTPQKRRRGSTPSAPPSGPPHASPTPSRSAESPEPSSINAVLREHHRTRLYVPPLHWTQTHLQLLGCRFTLHPPPDEGGAGSEAANAPTTDTDSQGQAMSAGASKALDDAIREAIAHIRHTPSTEVRTLAVRGLLDAHGFRQASSDLRFHFNRRAVTMLPTQGVFSHPSNPTAPCLVYLDLNTVAMRRDESVKLSSTTSQVNAPIARLRAIYRRRIQPQQEQEDQYIMAVLIGLAQLRRLQLAEGRAVDCPDTVAVQLLALSTNARGLYFYAARAPVAFLDKLDHPSRHFPGGSFHVPYYRISLTSTDYVRRLGGALAVVRSACI